ncbi:MAG: tRNA adenosine(34) deaminase TadA [Parvularcula sp.]
MADHPLDRAACERWMDFALGLARKAGEAGEVPVGAVVLSPRGELIGKGQNAPISSRDPSAHAEIMALRAAALTMGNYRLTDCTLVVTLEPCAMCAGAIAHARIGNLIYGAYDVKGGAVDHGPRLYLHDTIHHRPTVKGGIRARESGKILTDFFRARRK